MTEKTPIAVAHGDGIGPEIMKAALQILEAGGAQLDVRPIEVGEQVYLAGHSAGIKPEAWDTLRETKVLFKAPITTPQGGGYKSLNVTIRKTLSLYANVRPCVSYYPFIETKHPLMDVVIVRENEEDLYGGIEHRQTDEVVQCLKLISRPGSERIIRYAFEYARANNRRKVTCFTKDNIMKLTDGLFHKLFDEIGEEYPELEKEHWIIDIGTAKLADYPEQFDVLVLENLYGDILSDIAAQLTGSVGLGGSANIGDNLAMFEAIHGSAPDIAGQGIANPSGLILAGVMMLNHIGQPQAATRVHNAWLKTIEDGQHTKDIFNREISKSSLNTDEFTAAVIERMGQKPERLDSMDYQKQDIIHADLGRVTRQDKQLVGVDVFLDWDENGRDPNRIGQILEEQVNTDALELTMITNRGMKVYPDGAPETFCTDHWRCRFMPPGGEPTPVKHKALLALLERVQSAGLDFIKTENLYTFDGEPGFSLGQGQ